MKKEYIKPEAEMMKFVETEEIMLGLEDTGLEVRSFVFQDVP